MASAAFVCAMEDILKVYRRPCNPNEPLVCMDETTKQLVKEVHNPIAMQPGKRACYDFEYERNDVCNFFMFYEPFGGRRYTTVTEHRTKIDWAHQIKELLEIHYPDVTKIVQVMDNLNTHTGASLYEAFPPEEARCLLERLEIHFTPKHGSWLNIAEIELRVLSGQCHNRRMPDIQTLQYEINKWQN